MKRNFWKAALISAAAYTLAGLIGVWGDFRYTAFAIVALQVTWTLFCIIRLIQLRRGGAYKTDAPSYDRDDYGFALGGSISSLALLVIVVVLTQ
jgi:hypothetical protein